MAYDSENIFAKILRGEIPNQTVYEDDGILAFHDIAPKTPVHVLVIPKGAYVDMDDFTANAPAEVISDFFRKSGQIARDLGVVEGGYRIVTNNGENAGQIVPHFHIHIMGGQRIEEGSMAKGMPEA
ncbi:histidine triad nucleotide-binding protein [Sneathiella chinensis]|uniref:Histidine triad nucleotide-binding protein n=1 Tax=Sneathiella chinensis TaxID=349750 RepID=A0ABQ5U0Q3_9PROT|nr:histidine triad nucleotide-binding protein [Sneathiella chinensis]GLQ05255.1 histidine triad nucleotide-binding protein [Sneathiella chinensis]